MKSKLSPNEKAFVELIKNIDPTLLAFLRERVLFICEQTAEDTKNWSENSMIHPRVYIQLNQEVQKYLGFNEN